MIPVVLSIAARTWSCSERAPAPTAASACAELAPIPDGDTVPSWATLPDGHVVATLPVDRDSARLRPGAFVDVVVAPGAPPLASDGLLLSAGRPWSLDADLPLSPNAAASVLVDRSEAAALEEAARRGTVTLVPSDGRATSCDPEIQQYRQWTMAVSDGRHPTQVVAPPRPPEAVAVDVAGTQAAIVTPYDRGDPVDVVFGDQTVAEGAIFLDLVPGDPAPRLRLLTDAPTARRLRELGPVPVGLVAADGRTGFANEPAVRTRLRFGDP